MRIRTIDEAFDLAYASYMRAAPKVSKGLDRERRDPTLTRILLDRLGAPDHGKRVVLVTGSKGKGSTALLLAALLEAHGLRVGLFTGPHLVDERERIRVNRREIPAADLVRLAEASAASVLAIDADLPAHRYVGPVGVMLAWAMSWFREQETDIDVIECGRGGLYDDTNVLQNEAAVLTPIMEEHLQHLGPTVLDVARNKAGIIKAGTRLAVSAAQRPEVARVLASAAAAQDAAFALCGRDFAVRQVQADTVGTRFDYYDPVLGTLHLAIGMLGAYQAENAAVAVRTVRSLLSFQVEPARATLSRARWPGRCQWLPGSPNVLLDGAIHRDAAQYVAAMLRQLPAPRVAIVGVPADKDYAGVLAAVGEVVEAIVVTRAHNPYLRFPADALAVASQVHPRVLAAPFIEEAWSQAVGVAGGHGTIAIVGTQSLIGDAERLLHQSTSLT